jgi:hypothetical protein
MSFLRYSFQNLYHQFFDEPKLCASFRHEPKASQKIGHTSGEKVKKMNFVSIFPNFEI